jgi:tRNA nucleotidyltransferase (CCA-adding enzyme)
MTDWFAAVSADRLHELDQIRAGAGGRCYLVGGYVRDRLLGLSPDDFDVVIEGDAMAVAHGLVRAYGGEVVVHPPFGTATWRSPAGLAYDLVSARRERYPAPAVLPQVRLGASLADDLSRRDFTVNAMALALTEGDPVLIDPLGGQADLGRGLIRALHAGSFVDDPTRLFRAIRYEQRYAFAIEPQTLAWMDAGRLALAALSGDRVRHELSWIVAERQAGRMLARAQNLGLWAAITADLAWDESAIAGWAVWEQARERLLTPLGPLSPGDADLVVVLALVGAGRHEAGALGRLNVPRAWRQAIVAAGALRPVPDRVSQIVVALDGLGPLGLIAAWVAHPAWRSAIERYGTEWRALHPRTTGADLIARGLRPGPQFGRLLSGLRAAVLDGEVTGPEAERDWLDRFQSQD